MVLLLICEGGLEGFVWNSYQAGGWWVWIVIGVVAIVMGVILARRRPGRECSPSFGLVLQFGFVWLPGSVRRQKSKHDFQGGVCLRLNHTCVALWILHRRCPIERNRLLLLELHILDNCLAPFNKSSNGDLTWQNGFWFSETTDQTRVQYALHFPPAPWSY